MSQALNYIYFTAPARFQAGPAVDWMLLAVHGFTLELIGLLDAAEAAPLYPASAVCPFRTSCLPRCKSAAERTAGKHDFM